MAAALATTVIAPSVTSGQPASAATPADKVPSDVVLLPDFVVDASRFTYSIPVRTWTAAEGFKRGDQIKIVSVRGDHSRVEPGGIYLVQGTYTLNSAPKALIALSLTTQGSGVRTNWTRKQVARIEVGSGEFSLVSAMPVSGEFHVSFYYSATPDTADKQTPSTLTGKSAGSSSASELSRSDVVLLPVYVVEAKRMLSGGSRGGIYFSNR